MKRSRIEAGIFAAGAALCLALAVGCGRAAEDRRDARDRNLRRAQAAKDCRLHRMWAAKCGEILARHGFIDTAPGKRYARVLTENFTG